MSAKTVYATITARDGQTTTRLRADLPDGATAVLVGISGGGMIGWFDLDRFRDGKLTAGTLRELFTPKEAEVDA